jgi:heat shock protein HslJ
MNKILLAVVVIITSCGTMKTTVPSSEENVGQTENQIISFKERYLKLESVKSGDILDYPGDVEITLFIDMPGSSYSGKSGCNSYFGSVEQIYQDQLRFRIGGSTEMMCEDNVMLWEAKYYKALMEKDFTVSETETTVLLSEVSGDVILSFTKVITPEE